MAIDKADDIIGQFRRIYPDCDSTQAQVLLQTVHRELCEDLPIMTDDWSLALSAGGRETEVGTGAPWYATGTSTVKDASGMLMIEHCVYRADGSSSRELQVTSAEELTANTPNWRNTPNGTPQFVYTFTNASGNVTVGLHPAPSSASSPGNGSGYPRLDLKARITNADVFSGVVTKPRTVRSHLIYVYGMAFHYSLEQNNGRQAEFMQLYQMERVKVANLLYGRQRQYKLNFRPAAPGKAPNVI